MSHDPIHELVTIQELSRQTRLSLATLHRYKAAGKIPFHQPGGKGSALRFPADAVQRAAVADAMDAAASVVQGSRKQLAGPRPAWLRPTNNN